MTYAVLTDCIHMKHALCFFSRYCLFLKTLFDPGVSLKDLQAH